MSISHTADVEDSLKISLQAASHEPPPASFRQPVGTTDSPSRLPVQPQVERQVGGLHGTDLPEGTEDRRTEQQRIVRGLKFRWGQQETTCQSFMLWLLSRAYSSTQELPLPTEIHPPLPDEVVRLVTLRCSGSTAELRFEQEEGRTMRSLWAVTKQDSPLSIFSAPHH